MDQRCENPRPLPELPELFIHFRGALPLCCLLVFVLRLLFSLVFLYLVPCTLYLSACAARGGGSTSPYDAATATDPAEGDLPATDDATAGTPGPAAAAAEAAGSAAGGAAGERL